MLKSAWFSWALPVVLCACGESTSVMSEGAQAPRMEMSCDPGEQLSCFCPDGDRTGRQRCTTAGQLEPCVCGGKQAPSAGGASGGMCKELGDARDCQSTSYESKELPTSMLFVLDRSRSMVCNLPPLQSSADCENDPQPVDGNAPSKWKITREALAKTFRELPSGGSLVGLSFFANDGDCGVDSTPAVELDTLATGQKDKLVRSLESMNPDGQTPIVGATILAYAHLHQEAKAPGNRYVVLLTDGSESCAPDGIEQLLTREVKRAREANIRTFVIGAPGSEQARSLLSELAYRGGTARDEKCLHDIDGPADEGDCHLDMTKSPDFVAALASALGTVSSAAQSCEFPVADSKDPNNVNVQYTPGNGGAPRCFGRDDSAPCDDGANGWQFARGPAGEMDSSKVVLCGEACATIRSDPAARIDILIGCESIQYL